MPIGFHMDYDTWFPFFWLVSWEMFFVFLDGCVLHGSRGLQCLHFWKGAQCVFWPVFVGVESFLFRGFGSFVGVLSIVSPDSLLLRRHFGLSARIRLCRLWKGCGDSLFSRVAVRLPESQKPETVFRVRLQADGLIDSIEACFNLIYYLRKNTQAHIFCTRVYYV